MLPIVRQYEHEFNRKLLTKADRLKGFYFKFNLGGLLRGDTAARTQFYQAMLRSGGMKPDEVRRLEDLPPLGGKANELWISAVTCIRSNSIQHYVKEVRRMGKNQQKNKFFNMKASADGKSADIFIYGEITKWAWEEYGEVSSITFKEELDSLGDGIETIKLYINSPGGIVFETMAIIAMLQRHPAKIISYIDGVGASCASVLPMISDKIIMYANSMLMIHNAWTYASGNAEQLRKAADDIERINQSMIQFYLDRAGDKLDSDTLKGIA